MRLATPQPPIDLWIEEPTHLDGDLLGFGARLESSARRSIPLWFRFPAQQGPKLTRLADPFVAATILYAMRERRRLRVHGSVSTELLANLADFQSAFCAFHPREFTPVDVEADRVFSPSGFQRSPSGITAFSGGVDGSFSIYRHTHLSPIPAKRPLQAALLVHGFDVPLNDPRTFNEIVNRCRAFTSDAGLSLYTAATNLRSLPLKWEVFFGSAVASALLFFQSAYTFALLPSAHSFHHLRLETGSNQLTDPLLSSGLMQIVHDGSAYGRIDKLQHLSNWPMAMRHLRVCWEGRTSENCCRCEKCLRTMLMLSVTGADDVPAFPHKLTPSVIENMSIPTLGGLHELEYLLSVSANETPRPWWHDALTRAVARNRRYRRLQDFGRKSAHALPSSLRQGLVKVARRILPRIPAAHRPPPFPTEAPPLVSTRV